ncbi:hypothetical protein V6B33_17715 [Mangrovibacillus sp. Mu-81]|uniref:hypothetical protein n=1 Tax=Mangrovibacillus sp. Mu-81 TaxID=3121478 RepID=UPI002FE4E955
MIWLTFIYAVLLAVVHISGKHLKFLEVLPRSRFLSIAGGVSVAYVFVHILPELEEHQESLSESSEMLTFLNHHAYLVALIGLLMFYGIEKMVSTSRKENRMETGENEAGTGAFWLHISTFFVYNGLIGYLLVHRDVEGWMNLLLYVIAMGLHFFVVDYGLRTHHRTIYNAVGRWILAGAIVFGWLIGAMTEIHDILLALLFAFLSGGIVLNVLKEEIPDEKESSFISFFSGTIGYVVLLLVVG